MMPDGGDAPRNAGIGGRIDAWLGKLGLTRTNAWRLGLAFLIGFAGSLVFILIHLPLPWFLGSLTACIIASVLAAPIERPVQLSVAMRAVLGVAVGAAFTPELLTRFSGMALSLTLLLPFMLAIIYFGMIYFERVELRLASMHLR